MRKGKVNEVKCHTCVNCTLKRHSLLQGLTEAELEKLESRRRVIDVKKGKTIFREGMTSMGLLCLNKGKVKVVRSMDKGAEQIIALRKPVNFIGFRTLIQNRKHISSAIALEDVSVCIIHKDDFLDIMESNGQLAKRIINMLASELDAADRHAEIITSKDLRSRLAEAIIRVLEFYGRNPEDDNRLNVLLKRSDMAGLSNMTTANVIRTMSAFSKEGLIRTDLRKIWILKENDLKKIVGPVSTGLDN